MLYSTDEHRNPVQLTTGHRLSTHNGVRYPPSLTTDFGLERVIQTQDITIGGLKSSQIALKEIIDKWKMKKL